MCSYKHKTVANKNGENSGRFKEVFCVVLLFEREGEGFDFDVTCDV